MGVIITRAGLIAHVLDQPLNPVCIGVDVGKLHDSTALCVSEVITCPTGKFHLQHELDLGHLTSKGEWVPPRGVEEVMRSEYTIRHITRLPLGTSYPVVAEHLADLLCSPLFVERKLRLLLDVTGVGQAIYDDLRREIKLRPAAQHVMLRPLTFVRGQNYNRLRGSLGKAYLVSRLQSLLQGGRVHGPDTSEMHATLEELKVYQIKLTENGSDIYGAMGPQEHDDLVTAMALSCLEDPHSEAVTYSQRLF